MHSLLTSMFSVSTNNRYNRTLWSCCCYGHVNVIPSWTEVEKITSVQKIHHKGLFDLFFRTSFAFQLNFVYEPVHLFFPYKPAETCNPSSICLDIMSRYHASLCFRPSGCLHSYTHPSTCVHLSMCVFVYVSVKGPSEVWGQRGRRAPG